MAREIHGYDESLKASGTLLPLIRLPLSYGHTVDFLDRSKVTTYIALEPNHTMHRMLRKSANAAGYSELDGSPILLPCYSQDTQKILTIISQGPPPVDTIISVLTIWTLPSLECTMVLLVRDLLKPGGELLFYEHVLRLRDDVAWWQKFWAPLWCFKFSCLMDVGCIAARMSG